jgi:hypothetical protein
MIVKGKQVTENIVKIAEAVWIPRMTWLLAFSKGHGSPPPR